jgi:antitoxin VapB
MALNIKDPEAERLAARVAELAHENKTQAVRQALRERLERLEMATGRRGRSALREFMETEVWPLVPDEVKGKPLTKEEEEEILGFGPGGF